jgi:CHAD domain-containing protein
MKQSADAEALGREYSGDDPHGPCVRRLAVDIFRATSSVHGLVKADVPVLAAAALLHDIGMSVDPAAHNEGSRRLILKRGVPGLGRKGAAVAACVAGFHRGRVPVRGDAVLRSLRPADRTRALRMAAILRVADGLDFSHAQAVKGIDGIEMARGIRLVVTGIGDLSADVLRANEKADLWNAVMPVPIVICLPGEKFVPQPYLAPLSKAAEAGGRIIAFQMEAIARLEADARSGSVDAIHDMRGAFRRLRVALRLFRGAIDRQAAQIIYDDARWAAGRLGAVRDEDVLNEWLAKKTQTAEGGGGAALDRLLAESDARRAEARRALGEAFDSRRYRRMVRALGNLLLRPAPRTGPGAQPAYGRAVRAIDRAWKRMLRLDRGFCPTAEAVHELRKAGKRTRYAAEFFRGFFEEEGIERFIRDLKDEQDTLGALRDAQVHAERLVDRLRQASDPSEQPEFRAAICALLDARRREQEATAEGFLQAWGRLRGRKNRRRVKRLLKGKTEKVSE